MLLLQELGLGLSPLGNLLHWPRTGQSSLAGPLHLSPQPCQCPPASKAISRQVAPELEFLQQQHSETLQQLH